MLFRDFKKAYVNFCEEEVCREIALAKRRYLRKENALKSQCILNEPYIRGSEIEKIDMIPGDEDVILEDFLPLEETVEDDNIAKNMKLLSDREKKVVSLYFEEGLYLKEISIHINASRINTASEVYRRSIKKMKDEKKGE